MSPLFNEPTSNKSSRLAPAQCDQIGRNFAIWLLLLQHFLHFQTNDQFQNMVCCTHFGIWMQMYWILNLIFDILATVLATFPNIGRFFSIFWSLYSSFRFDQIHNCHRYNFGHTLLCYPSRTLMFDNPVVKQKLKLSSTFRHGQIY